MSKLSTYAQTLHLRAVREHVQSLTPDKSASGFSDEMLWEMKLLNSAVSRYNMECKKVK